MLDEERRRQKAEQKERVRKRIQVNVDPSKYQYIPPKKQPGYYDNDIEQRVAIYVRVSTDNVMQTTSYELQKKYYEDFVVRHPKWTLIKIYADEGISGTSLKHRDAFNRMIADCKEGKIDLIITKSVSRFARNVEDFLGVVRSLAERKPPVGVFFESECVYSLNDDSQMALSFQATMAEEESHIRSRSMEASLRMRLDNGIPLTPKLFGYMHDAEGNLIVNPVEAPTVKLGYYMYLYGYTAQQIADAFIALGRKTYFGKINWTSSGVVQMLRNERHCGDVVTRKTYTVSYRSHKVEPNRGQKGQSWYYDHHEAIVSRADYIAVQRLLDSAKYRNKSFLPELRVIETGLLKGFVVINPRWGGFTEQDYYQAAQSVFPTEDENASTVEASDPQFQVEAGDFDLRGFEVARSELFDTQSPSVTIAERSLKFSMVCINKFADKQSVELLINPLTKQLAVRPSDGSNRNAVLFSKRVTGRMMPRVIPAAAFGPTLFSILGWNPDWKYRTFGSFYEQDGEIAYVFDMKETEAIVKSYMVGGDSNGSPVAPTGKSVRAFPESWVSNFGPQYYLHKQETTALETQTEQEWKLHLEGQLFNTGMKLDVTNFDTIQEYIRSELSGTGTQESAT